LTETTDPADRPAPSDEAQGLKAGAISFLDATVIGLASTAPTYSLAAVIGTVAVVVGIQAPAALLVSFIPMFFIAAAFYYGSIPHKLLQIAERPVLVVPPDGDE
jgi:hypothetical protein